MKKILEKYSTTVVLLMIMAVMFAGIPLIINPGEYITGVFIISGMACAFLGAFVILFTGNEPIDPRQAGLLPVQGSLNLYKIASESGIAGNAYFLPPSFTGVPNIMQFNPVLTYHGGCMVPVKESFANQEPRGLVTIPASDPLYQDLLKRNALVVPKNVNDLTVLLSETLMDACEFSQKVSIDWESSRVTITLHEYRFKEGCEFVRSQSPECCVRYPCPMCSLCGTLITECINQVVTLEECSISSEQDVIAVFSFSRLSPRR
jgi:hypothetical protein